MHRRASIRLISPKSPPARRTGHGATLGPRQHHEFHHGSNCAHAMRNRPCALRMPCVRDCAHALAKSRSLQTLCAGQPATSTSAQRPLHLRRQTQAAPLSHHVVHLDPNIFASLSTSRDTREVLTREAALSHDLACSSPKRRLAGLSPISVLSPPTSLAHTLPRQLIDSLSRRLTYNLTQRAADSYPIALLKQSFSRGAHFSLRRHPTHPINSVHQFRSPRGGSSAHVT